MDLLGQSSGSAKLVKVSERAATIIKAAFLKTKLKNNNTSEHAEKFRVPDSQ